MSSQVILEARASVVVSAYQNGGDVKNAWAVLMQSIGGSEGERLVRRAAAERDVDADVVLDAAYRNHLRGN